MKLIRPPRLQSGDRVRVVAASGPVNRERFEAGVAALDGHYDLVYDEETLLARDGFLAGTDRSRLDALNSALADPECRAIFLARGGYGLTRILARIDGAALKANPKLVVGYSDVTALLSLCARIGVASVHGPMVSDFGDLAETDRESFFNVVENPAPGLLLSDLEELVPGRARGLLLGGNLEVLSRLLGTPFAPDFDAAILFLEEIGELPYRVDRLLTHLQAAGVLGSVAGIVLGDFTDCDEIEEGEVCPPMAADVVGERLGSLEIPVVLNGGFGHGDRKASLPYGTEVELDSDEGTLTALEGVVA